jgi:hypothetical protein
MPVTSGAKEARRRRGRKGASMPGLIGAHEPGRKQGWPWVAAGALIAAVLGLLGAAPLFNVKLDLGPRLDLWAVSNYGIPAWRQGYNENTAAGSRNRGFRVGDWYWGVTQYDVLPQAP